MNPFSYARADRPDEAVAVVAADPSAAFLAGGTTLVDLMKLRVLSPGRLVDIGRLPLATIEEIPGGLRLGAMARMSDTAADSRVAREFPAVAEALLASASPQLRNMATLGGNLLQRTRCAYYRDTAWACNKREPGTGCSAMDGENRMHAVLGTSDHCIATHASDFAVALMALDASVRVRGPRGERVIPIADLHLLPDETPNRETILEHGELITAIDLPTSPLAASSLYLKVRDRASYEFAIVSVAAALIVEDGRVADCRLALGGVATKPWRVQKAEAALRGLAATPENFASAALAATEGATARQHNAFKIPLVRRAIARALTDLAERR